MNPREVLTRAAPMPDAVLRYASHPDGVLDVYLPRASTPTPPPAPLPPAPLVLLVHGGFWRQDYDRRHVRPLAAALREEGYVVAVPEYRRVGAGGRGGWPVTAEDVDAVAARVHAMVSDLGQPVTSTAYVGHSAGGHLVLWLADQGHRVDRVVALAPVGDLRAAADERLGDSATQAFLGGTADEVPTHYAEADPMTRLGAHTAPDLVVLHGTDDDIVPVSLSRHLAREHPEVTLRELPGVEHFGVIDPASPAWAALLKVLR